jgi:glutathione S-transferase
MAMSLPITLFHSPQTRSSGALALLEVPGAPYKLHVLNMKVGELHQSASLAINPMSKGPWPLGNRFTSADVLRDTEGVG